VLISYVPSCRTIHNLETHPVLRGKTQFAVWRCKPTVKWWSQCRFHNLDTKLTNVMIFATVVGVMTISGNRKPFHGISWSPHLHVYGSAKATLTEWSLNTHHQGSVNRYAESCLKSGVRWMQWRAVNAVACLTHGHKSVDKHRNIAYR
jgi:hypothetical protein